jgi:hypothetical protein
MRTELLFNTCYVTDHPRRVPRLQLGRSCVGTVLAPLCLHRRQEWPFWALCIPSISHFITWYPNDTRKIAKPRTVRFFLPLYYFVLHMAKYSPEHCVLIRGRTLSSLYDKRQSLRPTARKVILLPVSLMFLCVEIGKQTILNCIWWKPSRCVISILLQ